MRGSRLAFYILSGFSSESRGVERPTELKLGVLHDSKNCINKFGCIPELGLSEYLVQKTYIEIIFVNN